MADELISFRIAPSLPEAQSPEEARRRVVEFLIAQAEQRPASRQGVAPPQDLTGFYRLLAKVLAQEQQPLAPEARVTLVEEYPPLPTGGEVITCALRRREPGTVSQTAPFSGVRNYKPLFREAFDDPYHPGFRVLVFGLWFDNLVELTCWAKTNRRADVRALWLEDVMLRYGWFFKQQGIQQLVYFGREADTHTPASGLFSRTLLYYLRTEKLYTIQEKTIEELLVSLSLDTTTISVM